MSDENILISEFKKGSAGEVVKVTIHEFRGQYYLDFRVWYFPEGSENMHPTKKGINLNVEQIPELSKAILEAGEYLQRMHGGKVADAVPQADFPEETA